jgi:LacI family transcriptional regulator
LNNKDDVAQDTVEKVRRVMQEMNYAASLAAKGMRSRASHVIGLVLPEVTEPFDLAIIHGVGLALKGSGYDLLIYAADNPPLNKRASWEKEHVAFLSNGLTDGDIVVTPTSPTFPESAPIVVIDPRSEGVSAPSVVATNRSGATAAMDYLINLGHRRIGFIGGRPDTQSAVDRFQGYKDALSRANMAFEPELVQPGDYTRQGGREAASRLLSMANRPTAIFAANDASALGILDAARSMAINVPGDLSVVGFDNILETELVTPRLTTVDQSIQEMGACAARLLIKILQGEEPETRLCEIPTTLVVRESCQPLSQ